MGVDFAIEFEPPLAFFCSTSISIYLTEDGRTRVCTPYGTHFFLEGL